MLLECRQPIPFGVANDELFFIKPSCHDANCICCDIFGYCPLFVGGKIPANAVAGVDGTQPGEGGGSIFGGAVTAKGGDGFRGEVRVEEFF